MLITPECEKMSKVKDESQAIGTFLDWLREERGLALGEWGDREDGLSPVLIPTEKLLAEYYEIDLDRVEEERRNLLTHQRALNDKHAAEKKVEELEARLEFVEQDCQARVDASSQAVEVMACQVAEMKKDASQGVCGVCGAKGVMGERCPECRDAAKKEEMDDGE